MHRKLVANKRWLLIRGLVNGRDYCTRISAKATTIVLSGKGDITQRFTKAGRQTNGNVLSTTNDFPCSCFKLAKPKRIATEEITLPNETIVVQLHLPRF